jgi:alpha-D-xyloside xylohydrolase
MKTEFLLLLLSLSLFTNSSAALEKQTDIMNDKIQKTPDGITITFDDGLLQLRLCDENIVHVAFAKDKNFFSRQSLSVENKPALSAPFEVASTQNAVTVITNRLRVRVDLQTGAVTFLDAAGKTILAEQPGGRELQPANVQGEKIYHIRQQWQPNQDESLYGLGQHQLGLMDIKGYDLELWQHNGTVIIPFLVSSRGYAILWDNTSYSKFGDIRQFEPLPAELLCDQQQNPGAITVTYFKGTNFEDELFRQTDRKIGIELPIADSRPNNLIHPSLPRSGSIGIRWQGYIQPQQTGDYLFKTFSGNGVKLWLDDKLIISDWWQNWLPYENIARVPLTAGSKYKICVEWLRDQNSNDMKLLWKKPAPQDGQAHDSSSTSLWSEVADGIDYYFVYGPQLDKVISGYRKLTGKAPMMPLWAFGLWQSRQRYKTADESLEVLKGFRSRNIPIDNIVQDWHYWKEDEWGSHQFELQRFPDPQAWIDTIHEKYNARLMISVWPKFYPGTENYKALHAHGFLYQAPLRLGLKDWLGHPFTYYDAFNPEARKLFWSQIERDLFSKKIDAWWMDATEPDMSAPDVNTQKELLNPTALGTGARVLNAYSLMNSKAIYDGQRAAAPNQRVFILTRSAFAGQQRYAAATWSGDTPSTWQALRKQITAGLGFSISGLPYWTMDIGGYTLPPRFAAGHPMSPQAREEWRELNTRWFQFGAFVPLLRVHGEGQKREMFNIAPENHPAYQAMLEYDKLRYRLLPYIYSLAAMVTHSNYTIMRPLVMDFQSDPGARNITDQYMFGPSLLINPVTEYKARTRKVYLPAGQGWYDLKTGKYFNGAQTIDAEAPYSDIPVFVKAGSILPFGPDIQYTTQKPAETIRLFVYTGRDAEFTIYEDENTNYNYENGSYSTITLKYNESTKTLTIAARKGAFPNMLRIRTFEIVWVNPDKPAALDFDSKPDQSVSYDGNKLTVTQKASPPSNHKPLSSYDEQARQLLSQMTLREKIGQMTQAEHGSLKDPNDVEKYFLGSILCGGNADPEQGNTLQAWTDLYDMYQKHALKTRLAIPLLFGVDAVHGHSNVIGATIFPHNIGLGCTRDPDLVRQIARTTATEVRATGINWTFSPCVTVPQDQRWGRAYEGFSENPKLVKLLGEAAVRGYQNDNLSDSLSILACMKHYAGDGGTTFGSAKFPSLLDQGDTRLDEQTMHSIHILPYTSVNKLGLGSVMPSFSSWNGLKCSADKHLLTDILKNDLGFEGFLISDYAAIDQLNPDYKTAVEITVNAGMDMAMAPRNYRKFFTSIEQLVNEGKVPLSRIDDAVTRILRVKFAMGLMDKNKSPLADRSLHKFFGCDEHRLLARRAVRKSLVLLKNNENILPLAKNLDRIHVAGKNADDIGNQCGGWTITWQGRSGSTTTGGTTILQAIKEAVSENTKVTFSKDGTGADGANVGIVVIGETPYAEGLGDVKIPEISDEDLTTVRNMKNAGIGVVVILISGRPMLINDVLDLADGFIAAWLPGTQGRGVTDVIFGDYNPTGRLSFTWPRSALQYPTNTTDPNYNPLFDFGFGLSYEK